MFIKIQLLPLMKDDEPKFIILNTDRIISIGVDAHNRCTIEMEFDNSHWILHSEYARLSALLMPAPIEAAVPIESIALPLSLAWHTVEALMDAQQMKALIASGKKIDAVRLYRQTRIDFMEAKTIVEVAMKYAQAPALPADVMEWVKNLPSLESIGGNDTFEHLADIVNILLDYMPKEAE